MDVDEFAARAWPPGERLQRYLLLGAAASLLGLSYLYATVPGASAYEPSPVTQYPVVTWVLFALVVTGAVLVYVGDASNPTGYWRYALALSVTNYGLFMFLPEFREYALYGRGHSDAIPHLGYVKGIVSSGTLPTVDGEVVWYPISHLLSAELTLLGLPLSTTKYLLAFLFVTLYMLGIALALSVLFDSRRAVLLGLAAGTPLMLGPFHAGFYPHLFSFSLLPIALVGIERYRTTSSSADFAFLLALAVLVVFFHPVTLLLLLVVFSVVAFVSRASGTVAVRPTVAFRYSTTLALAIVGLGWYAQFDRTRWKLQSALRSLSESSAPAGAEVGRAQEAVLSVGQILIRFVQLYGTIFVYLVLAGLVSLYVFRRLLRRDARYVDFLLLGQFVVGVVVAIVFLATDLSATGPVRVSRYMTMFAALLVGLGTVEAVSQRVPRHRFVSFVLVVGILVAAIVGAGALYKPNKHMTHAEVEGTEFVLSERVDDAKIWSYKGDKNMQVFVLGADSAASSPSDFRPSEYPGFYALGYDENQTAAETFGASYLVTKAHDRVQHTAEYYFPEQRDAQFVYGDSHLRRLRADSTATKVYDNGGLEVWRVENRTRSTENSSNDSRGDTGPESTHRPRLSLETARHTGMTPAVDGRNHIASARPTQGVDRPLAVTVRSRAFERSDERAPSTKPLGREAGFIPTEVQR